MGRFIDLTGMRFGRWTVLRYAGSRNRVALWECRCDCGKIKNVRSDCLRRGESKSCGCLSAEVTTKRNTLRAKHGMSRTRLHSLWRGMKCRCRPSCPKHEIERYYERGIRVCPEWENDFEAFYRWAMAHGYRDELSIDRIDNDGNYEPTNCRWVTEEVQANNRSSSRFITYNGETKTIAEWAKELNINSSTLRTNLSRGKSLQEIIEEMGP